MMVRIPWSRARVLSSATPRRHAATSMMTATVNRVADRILSDVNKSTARMDDLLDEPTFDVPRPSFELLNSRTKVAREAILGLTPSTVDPFSLVDSDLRTLNDDVKRLLGSESSALGPIAKYFFEHSSGKKLRPALVLLFAKALNGGNVHPSQKRLAEITEMIHTASLLHDDVIDKADTRRGVTAAHQKFGNKRAVLAGDLLLARASVCLARLRNVNVVEILSTVVGDMVRGEVMQMAALSQEQAERNEDITLYLRKNYYKTGSLMANACLATVFFSEGFSEERRETLNNCAYWYGEALGQAFQLVDDALDFEGSLSSLGKPSLADVKLGIATYPVLMARRSYPSLSPMIERKFSQPGDVEYALGCVQESNAVAKTRELAMLYCKRAADVAREALDPGPERDALIRLAALVGERKK